MYKKLQQLKANEHITEDQYKNLKPTKTQIPKLKGRHKIHKDDHPLREIVDGRDSVAKPVDKHISQIIKPYDEENEYRIRNSEELVERLGELKVEEDEVLVSYDVVALYPSIPQQEAIEVVYDKLKNDD